MILLVYFRSRTSSIHHVGTLSSPTQPLWYAKVVVHLQLYIDKEPIHGMVRYFKAYHHGKCLIPHVGNYESKWNVQ